MKGSVIIVVGGGTGFVGKALVSALMKNGYSPIVVTRTPKKVPGSIQSYTWNDVLNLRDLPSDCVGVINLAGSNLLQARRWNKEFKDEIYYSRVGTTKDLKQLILRSQYKPGVFVATSAIGYYPPSLTKEYTEDSTEGGIESNFFSNLCKDIEAASEGLDESHTRTVAIRVGIVLHGSGGMIATSYWPFYFGLGGCLGSGIQWMSWIHLTDLCALYLHALESKSIRGVLNGTAPNPVTNAEFTKSFASAMWRFAICHSPEFLVNYLFGPEKATILLQGQKVIPKRTLESGFVFLYPSLKQAISEILKK